MSISSQTQITKMQSISTDLSTTGNDVLSVGKTLGSSTSDKSLQIIEQKLEEISTQLTSISQGVYDYSKKIDSATTQVNLLLQKQKEESEKVSV